MKAKKSSKSAANYKTSTPTRKCTFCGILVELKNLGRHNIEVHSMLRSQGRYSIDFQRFNPIPSFKSIGNVEYDTDISAASEADSDECNGENKVEKSNSDGQQSCQQSSQQSSQQSTDFNDGDKITMNTPKIAEKSTIDGQAQGDHQRRKDKTDSIDRDLAKLQEDRTVSTTADEFKNKFGRPELSIEYDGEFTELVLSFRVKSTPKSKAKNAR